MAKILVIEDEDNLRFSVTRALRNDGHECAEADGLDAASELLRRHVFDGVVTDVNLGGEDKRTGVDLLRTLRADGFEGAIIVITAYGTVEKAVEAMRDGADDYLQKPLRMAELSLVVARAIENRRARARLSMYERRERDAAKGEPMYGQSPAWLRTLSMAERLASVPLPGAGSVSDGASGGSTGTLPVVLLLGETGSGKGLLARHIHTIASVPCGRVAGEDGKPENSERESGPAPFVHVNCASLPASLIESELFGHERGAFTDAKVAHPGLFETAEGGTIFLDEIGDMPLELQSKLLLVVERGVYRRVGSTRERRARARVIAATNVDLRSRIARGEFRPDLFYRLSALSITLPPLREREGDVIPMSREMLARFAAEFRRPAVRFTATAEHALLAHDWPGNVRELANTVQRAVMLTDAPEIDAADLALPGGQQDRSQPAALGHNNAAGGPIMGTDPASMRFDFSNGPLNADEIEKQLIIQALQYTSGNVSKAAKLIGMNRGSLRYRIERAGLEDLVQRTSSEP